MQNFANFMKISCLQCIFSFVGFREALQNKLFPVFPVFEDTPFLGATPILQPATLSFSHTFDSTLAMSFSHFDPSTFLLKVSCVGLEILLSG